MDQKEPISDNITVKTSVFEGPLSLLLDMVEKRKLFINDISLAEVADEYIEKIHSYTEFPVDDATHFLSVASTLLLIKSRSLLPGFVVTEEEKGNISELKSKLELLSLYRKAGQKIEKMWSETHVTTSFEKKLQVEFSPGKTLSKDSLLSAIQFVIMSFPQFVEHAKVAVKRVRSLEETISMITDRISKHLRFSFKDFAGEDSGKDHKERKVGVILSFLAILELVKRGVVEVKQNAMFEDIEIESAKIDIPRYN